MPLESPSPLWIKDNVTLAKYCQDWLTLKRIALDTEFIRTDTYYPLPGLIQLNTGSEIFLIDPLTINQWQPFLKILEHPGIIKILHSCSEDLEVLQLLTGAIPKPLFDTQLTAAYAGVGYSLGYQKMVKKLLDIELPKDETRSNWRQRPLTDAQTRYAALDVVHLLQVHTILEQMLNGKQARDWAAEDCQRMESTILNNDPENAWKDVKRSWQLRPQQLAVLKALCIYREEQSKKRDLPRNRVIPKGSLWPMARYQPDNLKSLARIQDMKPGIIKKEGQKLLNIIQVAAKTPEEAQPAPLPGPLPKKTREFGKTIKDLVSQQAIQLDLPVEILLPSKVTTPILRSWLETGRFDLPDNLQGWRREIIGKPLISELNSLIES